MATQDFNNSDNTLCIDNTRPDDNIQVQKNDNQELKRAAAVAVGAAAVGAGGMALGQTILNHEEEHVQEEVVLDDTVDNDTGVAQGVTDDMSFSEAFSQARAELGPGGLFHWHGRAYNTYTKEEWDSMSKEERQAYAERVKDDISDDERHNAMAHNSGGHASQTDHTEHTNTNISQNHTTTEVTGEDDSDVVIIGVEDVETDDGSIITVGSARIDGNDVVLVDANYDGTFDVAAMDANQNGQFDQDEYMSLEGQNLTVDEFRAMGHQNDLAAREGIMGDVPNDDDNTIPDTDYLASNDMPDYTQDYDSSVDMALA